MTQAAILDTPALQAVLGRAAVYELLAVAFAYPDAESLDELRELLDLIRDHEAAGATSLRDALDEVAECAVSANVAMLGAEHTRLFAGQVACSAHETEYEFDPFAKSRQLADIAGFYRAFGLKPVGERSGPPDFIATECEFMGFLLRKQVYAAAEGLDAQEAICLEAQRSFLEDHLGRWVPVFERELRGQLEVPSLYLAAARLCARFVADEVALLDVRPRPYAQRLSSAGDADPFACAMCPASSEDEAEVLPGLPGMPQEKEQGR